MKDYEDLNETSIVLKLEFGKNSFLLTGDAGKEAESDMLKEYGSLSADVLKAGHHGSSTSSSDKFLKAVHPRFAAISVGADNDYNHPHPETIKRLKKNKIIFYQTNLSGSVRFYSDGNAIEVKAEK